MDDLSDQGFYIFPAFDDHSPIDLIAVDVNGHSYRLQVKYRTKDPRKKTNRYGIQATSVINGKKVSIDRSMIDGWAIYLADDKKIAYIHKSRLCDKTGLTIDPNEDNGRLAEWLKASVC